MMKNIFNYGYQSLGDFEGAINEFGWVVYENALSPAFVDEINQDLEHAYLVRRKVQEQNGIADNMEGTLHHLLEHDNFSLRFIENMYCDAQIKRFLGGTYILNGINAVMNYQKSSYVGNVHRDNRTYLANSRMMIQMIVTLDDFTHENGATYFLSGSHKIAPKPGDGYFYKHAKQAITGKGSIILFDSNIWHAAGKNTTPVARRALTLGYTRPYFKQQFDYPRFLGYEFGKTLSAGARQIIGYNARVAESLNEWYQPPHLRMYQPGQG